MLDVQVHRREKYAFTCCGRRVSWRAVRAVVFVSLFVIVLGVVLARAVRRRQDVWATSLDVILALLALFAPLP